MRDLRPVTATEYVDIPRPALTWVVQQLLPRPAFAILLGEPKAGKSFLALQLSLAVAHGDPIWGQPTQQGNVLYLQFDTSEFVWRERLRQLAQRGVSIEGPLYMIHPEDAPPTCDVLRNATQAALKRLIERTDPSVIVWDALREVHGKKEDSSTDIKEVCDAIATLCAGRTALVIHHTPKLSNREDVRIVDLARGSSYLSGRADVILCLLDHTLHVVSRFTEHTEHKGTRTPCGFWHFPSMEHQSQLAALCARYPNLTHAAIAQQHAGDFNLRPSSLLTLLDQQSECVHVTRS